jgi:hypothetical protein
VAECNTLAFFYNLAHVTVMDCNDFLMSAQEKMRVPKVRDFLVGIGSAGARDVSTGTHDVIYKYKTCISKHGIQSDGRLWRASEIHPVSVMSFISLMEYCVSRAVPETYPPSIPLVISAPA